MCYDKNGSVIMNKYRLGIEGMRCGMCEVHVEETISKNFKTKKVNASRFKNEVVVFTEENLNEDDFKKVLDPTGYCIISYSREMAKKTFFGWK